MPTVSCVSHCNEFEQACKIVSVFVSQLNKINLSNELESSTTIELNLNLRKIYTYSVYTCTDISYSVCYITSN